MFTHKRMFASAIAASVLLVISGCATMFTPGMQEVPVASSPEGAEVFIDGDFVGITPIIVSVKANENHEVVVKLGNDEMTWMLERRVGVGGLGIAGDILIAIPAAYASYWLIDFGLGCAPGSGWSSCNPSSGASIALGAGAALVGVVPIAVDISTNQFYELVPKEIVAEFE